VKDDVIDAWNAGLAAEYCRREAEAVEREILSEDSGINFSFGTLVLIVRAAERRLNPSAGDMQRLTAAWTRWDKAGQRRTRRAQPPKRETSPQVS